MSEWRIYILQYSFLESADKIRTREFPASSDEEAEKLRSVQDVVDYLKAHGIEDG